MSDYILHNDQTIPVLAWIGPQRDDITRDNLRCMAEAGFNINLGAVDEEKILPVLDLCAETGVRLLWNHPAFDLGRKTPETGPGYQLTPEEKDRIRALVLKVKDHPGLYGYHVHDEPALADLDWNTAVIREIEAHDSYHMCYVNHNAPVIQGAYGAGTQEALWRAWIKKSSPRYLSYDHYPIEQKPWEVVKALGDAPNIFGNIVVKPNYFACLDFARSFCSALELPLWAFTCSVPHWSYPEPTEGHLRFQLMCDLAYGARGLQYFTYWGDRSLVGSNGEPNPTYYLAQRVNRDIHALWKKLKGLRSIGVYHTGPVWEGTTRLMMYPVEAWGMDHLGLRFKCIGDPAVLGVFDDPDGNMYVLAVNRNPVESGTISLDPSLDDTVPHKWHPLKPGEGKLFRIPADGPPVEA
ncbi:MAG: hypothetical protein ACYDCO_05270 [Armatimonadota bacterium]